MFICHCEPFVTCHSERSEESGISQGKLRVAISEIAEPVPSVSEESNSSQ